MSIKRIKKRHLVSLNTARIKLRNQHPRISEDLKIIFDALKDYIETHSQTLIYDDDGLIDIDD